MRKHLKIKDKYYEILHEFPVLHNGWECDDKGYLVILNHNITGLVMTNHGSPYFVEKEEVMEKLAEYQEAKHNLLSYALSAGLITKEEYVEDV